MDIDLDLDTGRDVDKSISNNIDAYTIESVLDIFWSCAKKKKRFRKYIQTLPDL